MPTRILIRLSLLAGLMALRALPISHYPDIAPPTVIISANYPGASTETLIRTVAGPIGACPPCALTVYL